jgi:hypothetical protein
LDRQHAQHGRKGMSGQDREIPVKAGNGRERLLQAGNSRSRQIKAGVTAFRSWLDWSWGWDSVRVLTLHRTAVLCGMLRCRIWVATSRWAVPTCA